MPARRRSNWLADFKFDGLDFTVRKTGAKARLDGKVLHEVAVWVRYWLIVRAVVLWRFLSDRGRPTLRFSPAMPRPWYFIRSAAAWSGVRVVGPGEPAEAEVHFDDATWSVSGTPALARNLNFGCVDIAKSTVARVFAEVFGYPLHVDPATYRGRAVAKSEINSMHDGTEVDCPCEPVAGRVYQRLVDTEEAGLVRDLRTSIVGGIAVLVCVKRRRTCDRFASIANVGVSLAAPASVFSGEEVAAIERFAARLGLDWGTLDILRDRNDNRIYIVDANNTDVGPVLALGLADQCRATAIVGRALRKFVVSS